MHKVKIIINPSSGRQAMEGKIDRLAKKLLDNGYLVSKFFTKKRYDAKKETIQTCKEDWDYIVVSGGDGTINEVAAGMALSENKIPVVILAGGTVNDFANHMKLPQKVDEIYQMISKGKTVDVDLGRSGNDYFVNVAAAGLLTEVAHQVPIEAKAMLGRLAYYLEGLKEFLSMNMEPVKMKFTSEEYTCEEEILLFIISNSSSIGGFKNLAPKADVSDSLLDVMIIKKSDLTEMANIFLKILRGEHINHPNVKYFQTKKITIESQNDVVVDIDGEYGGELPLTFEVVPKAMRLVVNN